MALEKIVIPMNSSFLRRRVPESSTQIQDRLPRLSLANLFKKPLQINVSIEDSFNKYNSRLEINYRNL